MAAALGEALVKSWWRNRSPGRRKQDVGAAVRR
jgi:hypothetical protein